MEEKDFSEKIINIRRVAKKISGGNKIGFSVLAAVGDKKGKVGAGLGKAADVRSAIQKAVRRAEKNIFEVPLRGTTIPHSVKVKRGAAKILLRPAPPGAGLIAGGPVRILAELAGIKDLSAKILGTTNKLSNTTATLSALKKLKPLNGSTGKKD
jgi:small subunit ribosomal protein S5